jgi:hypothetical protein
MVFAAARLPTTHLSGDLASPEDRRGHPEGNPMDPRQAIDEFRRQPRSRKVRRVITEQIVISPSTKLLAIYPDTARPVTRPRSGRSLKINWPAPR